MKRNPFAIAPIAALGGLLLILSSCTTPKTNTPSQGNAFIQKMPNGDLQVMGMGLPPANLAPGTEFSTSTAALRAVIHDGRPKFQFRLITYKPPGKTQDYSPKYLTWEYLQYQASAGGLQTNLPPKGEAIFNFSPDYIHRFLTDVETALTRPLP